MKNCEIRNCLGTGENRACEIKDLLKACNQRNRNRNRAKCMKYKTVNIVEK